MGVGDFDTKAAIIVRDDLAQWQRLNVTALAGSPQLIADSLTSDADSATADFGTGRGPKQPRGDVCARDPV